MEPLALAYRGELADILRRESELSFFRRLESECVRRTTRTGGGPRVYTE